MRKPWEKIDDHSMKLQISKLIKEHSKYEKAKKETMYWLLGSHFILLVLVYLLYTEFSQRHLVNVFSVVFDNKLIFLSIIFYFILVARVKVCMATEKEAKKDYKDIRAQVTDNFNNIWRYNYEMTACNEIVDVLDKEYDINISYK